MGFPPWWISRAIDCITNATFSITANGKNLVDIQAKQGLRQGCPLSPYIFILCTQVFSSLTASLPPRTSFGLSLSSHCLKLSHLLFADDLLLFTKIIPHSTEAIIRSLDLFQSWTGLTINQSKSCILFFKHCFALQKILMADRMGMPYNSSLKYRNISISCRCSRLSDFAPLLSSL